MHLFDELYSNTLKKYDIESKVMKNNIPKYIHISYILNMCYFFIPLIKANNCFLHG